MREIHDLNEEELTRGLLNQFLLTLYRTETPTELVAMARLGAERAVNAENETIQLFNLEDFLSVRQRIFALYPDVDSFVSAATDANEEQKEMYAQLYKHLCQLRE